MKGFFTVSENKEEEFDIRCALDEESASKSEIPNEQAELYAEVESTNTVIKSLRDTNNETKKKYFNKLLSLAQAGLVGNTAQPKLAKASMVKLKEEIVMVEGQRIKNSYMKDLGIRTLLLSLIGLVGILVVGQCSVLESAKAYIITAIGAFIGTWVSFGARKFNIVFEELAVLEEDMMEPLVRLLYIGLCSVIVFLFLNTGLFTIGVGEITTVELKDSAELQMVIGTLCGLFESKIGVNLYKRAVEIIKK